MSLFDSLASIFKSPMSDGRKVVLAHKEIETNDNVLIEKMLGIRKKLDPASLQWFSPPLFFDTTKARDNVEIWNRGGRGIFVQWLSAGAIGHSWIRFNTKTSPKYPLFSGYIKGAFEKVYLTNDAVANHSLNLIIGYRNFADFKMLDIALYTLRDAIIGDTDKSLSDLYTHLEFLKLNSLRPPTNPVDYLVPMASPDTEYSCALAPGGTEAVREIRFNLADLAAFRYAWVTGKVAAPTAPYITVPANQPVEFHNIALYGKTLYFSDNVGTKDMCISTIEDAP